MRLAPKILSCFILLSLSSFGWPQKDKPAYQYWKETDTETLWRGKYANCDYRYYVTLPAGFVGHGTHAPSPNHGFLVALPNAEKTQNTSSEDTRFIWVDAEYDFLDFKSLREAADYEWALLSLHKSGARQILQESVRLDKSVAIRTLGAYDSPTSKVLEEEVIVLRGGILYAIGLKTTYENQTDDRKKYNQLLSGFHFWRIHNC